MSKDEKPKLHATSDYSLFVFMRSNRPVDTNCRKYRALVESMKQYGFDPGHPIKVRRNECGKLEVVEGQHRFTAAKELGLVVYYIITTNEIPITVVNATIKPWSSKDYGLSYVNTPFHPNREQYKLVMGLADDIGMTPLAVASIYSNTTHKGNVAKVWAQGKYKITSADFADKVVDQFRKMALIDKRYQRESYLYGVFRLLLLHDIDTDRFIKNFSKLARETYPASTMESINKHFEDIYNHGKRDRRPIQFEIDESQKLRNNCGGPKKASSV